MAKNFIAGEGVDVDVDDVAGTATLSVPEASSGQATAGTNSTMRMSPRRVKEAIEAIGVTAEALASDGGDMVGIPGRRGPAYIRSIQEIIQSGGLSLQNDFSAVPDGARSGATITGTDNAAAINAAITAMLSDGLNLNIEPGVYRSNSAHTYNLSSVTATRTGAILGAGSRATRFLAGMSSNANFFTINGSFPNHDAFRIGGFAIERPDNGTTYGTGKGIALLAAWGFEVFDYYSFRNPVALDLTGSLLGEVRRLRSYYDKKGIYGGVSGSSPNDINFISCDFRASYQYGLDLVGGTNCKAIGCTFEGIGTENPGDANSSAVNLTSMGQAGMHAFQCASHFEANAGRDVSIMHDIFPAIYDFAGSHMLRTGTPTQTNSIYFQVTANSVTYNAPATLDVRGCGFGGLPFAMGSPNYTPSSAKRRVAFNIATHGGITFRDGADCYSHPTERPIVPEMVMRPIQNMMVGKVTDGSPATFAGYGAAASVTRASTGNYLIKVAGGANGYQITSIIPEAANVHSVQGYQENSTEMRIILRDSAGNGINGNFYVTGTLL